MLIPEHKIQEVLERTDLVQLVGRHVELKKSGRSFKGRCPFHQEKSASFHVTPEMRRFKCFGCQAGGDAIAFLQRYLGKTFVDAVKDLAKEAGVDLGGVEDPGAKERAQLKDATDLAQRHFVESLWHPTVGKAARDYLLSRGIPEETSRAFGLGFAPDGWTDLADRLLKEGMLEWAEKAGLVSRRTRGDGFYDMFRNRLIIPIRSPEGRTIAFGGRVMDAAPGAEKDELRGPKYLNSKESRLYNKSDVLYGLDQARDAIRQKKSAVLVEGYFDCIGMHQAGVKHAVALCSTALTPGHLAVLSRAEAKELVLLLDGDDAGRKAVERLAGSILAAGASARVAMLPEGEDPDTFARKAGDKGLAELVQTARPLTEHLFETVLPGGAGASFEDKMKAVERLKPVATLLPVGLMRSAFFAGLAKHMGLPAAELETALRGKAPAPVKAAPKAPWVAPQERERPPDSLEALLVAAALRKPGLLTADPYQTSDDITHPGLRAVLAHALTSRSAEDALFEASEGAKRALQQAARELPQDEGGLEKAYFDVAKRLKLRRIEEQLSHIAKVVREVAEKGEISEEVRRLQSERMDLMELKKKVLAEPKR